LRGHSKNDYRLRFVTLDGSRPIRPMDLTSGLRCGLRFASGSEHTDLTDRLFLLFCKVKIQLLQPQTPLTALFVVGLVRHIGARHSLLSEANGGRHSRVSDSSVGALQHFLSRNATAFISPYKIAFLIFKAVIYCIARDRTAMLVQNRTAGTSLLITSKTIR